MSTQEVLASFFDLRLITVRSAKGNESRIAPERLEFDYQHIFREMAKAALN